MEEHERARIESLVGTHDELRRLWVEHLEYERRLAELDAMPILTGGQEFERKRLQKLKLAGRDRIAKILAEG